MFLVSFTAKSLERYKAVTGMINNAKHKEILQTHLLPVM